MQLNSQTGEALAREAILRTLEHGDQRRIVTTALDEARTQNPSLTYEALQFALLDLIRELTVRLDEDLLLSKR